MKNSSVNLSSANDSHSAVIAGAYLARDMLEGEESCPYEPGTDNRNLWMICRFGKASDNQKPKQPRSQTAKMAALIYEDRHIR